MGKSERTVQFDTEGHTHWPVLTMFRIFAFHKERQNVMEMDLKSPTTH